jgi:hypothetical protein
MKKIIYLFAATLAVMQLSSCSNDDIELINTESVETVTKTDLVVSVPTQSVYDQFNITNDFKSRFLSGSYNIGVYTFVYDGEGNLAASDSTYTQTFGRVEQTFDKLIAGPYTTVTVEMLVNSDNNYQSDSWLFVGKDKLSTLEIVNKDYTAYWYSAVGVVTNKVVIANEGVSIDATPKAIGAIIETYFLDFDKSSYKEVDLFTKDQPRGRFLSPNYSGDERFDYDKYLESNVWSSRGYDYYSTGFTSSAVRISIYLLEEGNLRYCFGVAINDSDGKPTNSFKVYPSKDSWFKFADGKTYYGGIDYIGGTQGSDCAAGMYSTYNELSSWYGSLVHNYNQTSTTDAKPYLTWGANASSVNNYMIGQGLTFLYDGTNENTYFAQYENSSSTLLYEYRFDLDKNNLSSVLLEYQKSSYTLSAIRSALAEEYSDLGYNEDGEYYYYESSTTAIGVFEYDDTYNVLYIPNSTRAGAPGQNLVKSLELKRLSRVTK